MKAIYKRVILKLSGEILGNDGFDIERLNSIVSIIKDGYGLGVELGVVIGGGNIFRGIEGDRIGFDRVRGDQIGMLATVINGLVLKELLNREGIKAEVLSNIDVEFVERFSKERADKLLKDGYVILFVGGTSNPYFSTDSAAALKALELRADAIIKITKVDGVFDKDPVKYRDARLYKEISFDEVIEKNLKVMDQTAFALCREYKIPIRVINYIPSTNLKRVLQGEEIGSIIR